MLKNYLKIAWRNITRHKVYVGNPVPNIDLRREEYSPFNKSLLYPCIYWASPFNYINNKIAIQQATHIIRCRIFKRDCNSCINNGFVIVQGKNNPVNITFPYSCNDIHNKSP